MTRLTTAQQPEEKPRHIVTETLEWRGVTIRVGYEADWLGLGEGFEAHAHLDLQVMEPKGAPLPVTDTGYRSEFLGGGEVEEAGGIVAYVTAWLEEMAESKSWRVARARWEQRDLFE